LSNNNKDVSLPGVYSWVSSKEILIRLRKAIDMGCEFSSYGISQKCGRWYCSIVVRKMTKEIREAIRTRKNEKKLQKKSEVGIDLGQITFITVSDGSSEAIREYGKMYDANHISHTEMIIRKRQSKASKIDEYNKKRIGSRHTKNRGKRLLNIGKLKHREAQQRLDIIHKAKMRIIYYDKQLNFPAELYDVRLIAFK
jgi:transposase